MQARKLPPHQQRVYVNNETGVTSTTLPSALASQQNDKISNFINRYIQPTVINNKQASGNSSIDESILGGMTEGFSIEDEKEINGMQSTRSHEKLMVDEAL